MLSLLLLEEVSPLSQAETMVDHPDHAWTKEEKIQKGEMEATKGFVRTGPLRERQESFAGISKATEVWIGSMAYSCLNDHCYQSSR